MPYVQFSEPQIAQTFLLTETVEVVVVEYTHVLDLQIGQYVSNSAIFPTLVGVGRLSFE
jgi:hypothetical protein